MNQRLIFSKFVFSKVCPFTFSAKTFITSLVGSWESRIFLDIRKELCLFVRAGAIVLLPLGELLREFM